MSLVAVAQRIGRRLAERGHGIQRIVNPLEHVRQDPPRDGKVNAEKTLAPHEQVESAAKLLPVVDELGLGDSTSKSLLAAIPFVEKPLCLLS